jgi:hypothetical protein
MARSLKVSEFQEILIGISGMKKYGKILLKKINFTKKMLEWHLMYMVIYLLIFIYCLIF